MRNHRLQNRSANTEDAFMRFSLCLFNSMSVAIVLLFCCTVVSGQTPAAPDDETGLVDPEGILHELAPDTIPLDSLNPKPANRARAIRLLQAVKRQNTGWNRQEAVYLLALLGHDYALNRDELLKVWHGCVFKEDNTSCDEMTAMALIGLYKQGHNELLRPLLTGCRNSDGALSEALGPFYADQLERNPKDFLTVLSAFAAKEQRGICWLAGAEDGGGMPPKTERKVLANLKVIGGDVANRCARGVRSGNSDADAANSDLPVAEPKKN